MKYNTLHTAYTVLSRNNLTKIAVNLLILCKNCETFDISFYFRDYFSPSPHRMLKKWWPDNILLYRLCNIVCGGRWGGGQWLSCLNNFCTRLNHISFYFRDYLFPSPLIQCWKKIITIYICIVCPILFVSGGGKSNVFVVSIIFARDCS
jgi:hypothetical protein